MGKLAIKGNQDTVRRFLTLALFLGAVMALSPGVAYAVPSEFSDLVSFRVGDFVLHEASLFEDHAPTGAIFLSFDGTPVPPAVVPTVIVFTEPVSEGGGISDLLFMDVAPLHVAFTFYSENDIGSFPVLPPVPTQGYRIVTIEETGQLQDVTDLLGAGSLEQGFFRILVQSDVDIVPEPSTWLLLGSGLAGLAWWRRRRVA